LSFLKQNLEIGRSDIKEACEKINVDTDNIVLIGVTKTVDIPVIEEAIELGATPLREFMLKQTRKKDLQLFAEVGKINKDAIADEMPLYIVIPAFIISELKTAFQIGFLLFVPFLIVDLVVTSILMSMGMMMLPPVMISLPFKLLLFVMVDGWHLLVKSLIMSFN